MAKTTLPTASELGVEDVLDVIEGLLNLQGEVHKTEYHMLCPVHSETDPSCDVNLKTGYWHCFSCHAGGDLANLVAKVMQISYADAKEMLRPGTPEAMLKIVKSKIAKAKTETGPIRLGTPSERVLHTPDRYKAGPMAYMRGRGFTIRTCHRWGIRYVPKTRLYHNDDDEKGFQITHSIAVPIRDQKGKLLAWCYRATERSEDWQPKYLYTPEFPLVEHWLGLDHHADADEIVVVEGALDAIWLDQCGVPALSMLGSSAFDSVRKIAVLKRYRRVLILADYDNAGILSAMKLGSLLEGEVPTSVCRYPKQAIRRMRSEGKKKLDPQDLTKAEVKLVVSRALPWMAWRLRTAA